MGETVDPETGTKTIETGSLRQRSEHLCVAWKATEDAVKHLILSEIYLRADEKARSSGLTSMGASVMTDIIEPIAQTCESQARSEVKNRKAEIVFTDTTAVGVARDKANACIRTQMRSKLREKVRTLFPLLHSARVDIRETHGRMA